MPFLFLFNKKDKKLTFDKDEIIKNIGLDSKKFRNRFYFRETSGFTGLGLKESIDILTDALFS